MFVCAHVYESGSYAVTQQEIWLLVSDWLATPTLENPMERCGQCSFKVFEGLKRSLKFFQRFVQ